MKRKKREKERKKKKKIKRHDAKVRSKQKEDDIHAI
jgi:hypothetical protein